MRRPANPKNFSGTVVVEWMNESAGESSPDWDYMNPEIMNAGDAWVGVSAQALGVDGGKSLLSGGNVTGSVKGSLSRNQIGTAACITLATNTRTTSTTKSPLVYATQHRKPWVRFTPAISWPSVSPSRPLS